MSTAALTVTVGQFSDKGRKETNEDFYGVVIPEGPALTTKGIAAVVADGMSGSAAGGEASEFCVKGFLSDYFSTPDTWTVKTSVHRVLRALNRWLCAQGNAGYGDALGLVSTFSAVVMKSTTAHLFHIGDTRIYLLRDGELEQLTTDHGVRGGHGREYLARALGVELDIEIDYQSVALEVGDRLLMTTDGVHSHLRAKDIAGTLMGHWDDLDVACRELVAAALAHGSPDNLTAQVLGVTALPLEDEDSFYRKLTALPFPPALSPGMILDGYRILRELHASKRTEIYLAEEEDTAERVVLKTPSVNYQDDPLYIDRFMHEAWVGRRLHHPHVMRILEPRRRSQCLYHVAEYIGGITLRQWMADHPQPRLAEARAIAQQIASGLRAFHRMEMIHQDLKPENVMIDHFGNVKIIDLGSTKIAGLAEIVRPLDENGILGTRNYAAPEYLFGGVPTAQSDIYSLGVMVYEMLTSQLPYGAHVTAALNRSGGQAPKGSSARARSRWRYQPATIYNPTVPAWVDGALAKAVHPDRHRRYETLSEFIHDLSRPNAAFLRRRRPVPLLERNPLAFWRALSLLLVLLNLLLFYFASR